MYAMGRIIISIMLFSEHNFSRNTNYHRGSIEVICGSMFSGKTEELIRRLRRAEFAKLPLKIFKPYIDTRYATNQVVSHDFNKINSTTVKHSSEIIALSSQIQVVGIDEAQFFDNELPSVCSLLANQGIRVIVAGLDMDYLGNPFGPIPQLMAISEHVTKVHAVCVICGAPANFSFRTAHHEDQILLGERNFYEPRCRSCYYDL